MLLYLLLSIIGFYHVVYGTVLIVLPRRYNESIPNIYKGRCCFFRTIVGNYFLSSALEYMLEKKENFFIVKSTRVVASFVGIVLVVISIRAFFQ